MYRYIAIFFATIRILILNKLSRYLRYIHIYVSTNMGKHCLQLVLTLLPLFSPYARRFSEQTDKKNPCWAVFSIIFKMADTTNACVLPACQLYRLLSLRARHEAIPFLFCCYVKYRIVYHIVTTVSGYVLYCRKMYHCRPSNFRAKIWKNNCAKFQKSGMGRLTAIHLSLTFVFFKCLLSCMSLANSSETWLHY